MLWECHCLFEIPISVLLDEYPDVDCGSYGSSIFSFLRDVILFSGAAALICIPTHGAQGLCFGDSASVPGAGVMIVEKS